MKKYLLLYSIALLLTAFVSGCGCGGEDAPALISIEVSPVNPSIVLGTSQQFIATGIFSDSTTQDLTGTVTWSLSNGAVASISNDAASKGLAHSLSAGTTTVSAAFESITGSTSLTVTAATLVSIEVSPANPSIVLGTSQQFIATGVFSDSSMQDVTASVIWSSSETSIATISNDTASKGSARSHSAGTTSITATSGPVSGSTSLTVTAATLVSINVTPANPSIALGSSQQFTATGIFTDNSTQNLTSSVTWNSSDTNIATISNDVSSKGSARSHSAGTTTITATSGAISGSTSLTVTAATLVSINVTPANPTVVKGMTQQFKATGTFTDNSTQDITSSVTWSSSDQAVATVSNAAGTKGLGTALSGGTTTITASSGNISGSTAMTVPSVTLVSIKVTPANPTVRLNSTIQFTATGTYSDNTTQNITTVVTWTSSDTSIATISNAPGTKGLATTDHKIGKTIITATLGTVSGSTTLTDP